MVIDEILPDWPRPEPPRSTGGLLNFMVKHPRKDPPPPLQVSFIPTPEGQARDLIKTAVMRHKSKGARIRFMAKRLKVDLAQAGKLYKGAFERLQHELMYEQYAENREYYDWQHTPEFFAYCRAYLDEIDRLNAESDRQFWQRIADGKEHVVAIEFGRELSMYLSRSFATGANYHGPMSRAANWLTEEDARILWVNKAITLEHGREETIFAHQFLVRDRERLSDTRMDREERFHCNKCGKELDYNTIGFNRKIGMHDYECLDCLGVEPEYVKSVISYYKSTGCTMFI